MDVTFHWEGQQIALSPRWVEGHEQLGGDSHFRLELVTPTPLSLSDLVGRSCALVLESDLGQRTIHGVVHQVTAVATSQLAEARIYQVEMVSAIQVLELRRRCRIFQELSSVDIVARVLEEGGASDGPPRRELSGDHRALRYLTQYNESDAGLARRLCEQHGFWWRLDEGDGRAAVVLADDVALAPQHGPVKVAEEAGLAAGQHRAWNLVSQRLPASGHARVRDYDFARPDLPIEGEHFGGVDWEQTLETYGAAERATTEEEAVSRARLLLESQRAEAATLRFDCSAITLRPGVRVPLEGTDEKSLGDGEVFVIALHHDWRHGDSYQLRVTATPSAIAYRLARNAPVPKINGVHAAVVTGPAGEEIFTDEHGCVRVRFFWDREGPTKQSSSLPVRVLQPNLAGSMLIPRIGWEVWVAFEEGDPDRPFVLGRAFNGKQRPPVALPANQTMTSISTASSPGAGCHNFLRYDDAAGRQNLHWNAGHAMDIDVGNTMTCQTMVDETRTIKGSQTITVGASQTESVSAARVTDVASQIIAVGATHELMTPKALHVKIGSETVTVGGALMEHIGSPADAFKDAATAAVMGVGGLLPGGAGAVAGVLGAVYSTYEAYEKGGKGAAGKEINKFLIGKIPGGDAFNDALDVVDASRKARGKDGWLDPVLGQAESPKAGEQEDGTVGGAAAAGGAGPADGGSGHRIYEVTGTTVESIGGLYAVVTPATSKWTTLGGSVIMVGGAHATIAGKVSWCTAGASLHTTGAYSVTAGSIVRDVRWLKSSLADYSSSAGGANTYAASSKLTLKCGALTVKGKLLLEVGGTQVVVAGDDVTVIGDNVTIEGPTACKEVHRS